MASATLYRMPGPGASVDARLMMRCAAPVEGVQVTDEQSAAMTARRVVRPARVVVKDLMLCVEQYCEGCISSFFLGLFSQGKIIKKKKYSSVGSCSPDSEFRSDRAQQKAVHLGRVDPVVDVRSRVVLPGPRLGYLYIYIYMRLVRTGTSMVCDQRAKSFGQSVLSCPCCPKKWSARGW